MAVVHCLPGASAVAAVLGERLFAFRRCVWLQGPPESSGGGGEAAGTHGLGYWF